MPLDPNNQDVANGFDRDDGSPGMLGTATPKGAIKVSIPGGDGTETIDDIPLGELPDSPEIERAEQGTIVHKFNLAWVDALTRIQTLGRGAIKFDSKGVATKILSSKIQHNKGDFASLIVTSESLSFDSPPDQFQIVPVELGVNIMKHPRYFYAFLGDGSGSTTEQQNQMVIRLLQDYFENPSAVYRDGITKLLLASIKNPNGSAPTGSATNTQPPPPVSGFQNKSDPSAVFAAGALVAGTDMAKRAALEIIQKYWRGEETPYIIGYQINWSAFYFRPQFLNPGGYVEDPMTDANPALPEYFYCPDWPPVTKANGGRTIFDLLTHINPQSYATTGLMDGPLQISWLRKADQYEEQRTWFKVDRTWIGSPVGFWDPQLNTSLPRPQDATLADQNKPNDNRWLNTATTAQ